MSSAPIRYGVPITSIDQLEQVYRFDESAYRDGGRGTECISWELFSDWWKAFPTGFLGAFDSDSPVAVVGLFPISSCWATRFMNHNTSESALDETTIKAGLDEMSHNARVHWYFSGLSARAEFQETRFRLPCLIGLSLFEWLKLNEQVNRDKEIVLAAEASTSIGNKLLQRYVPGQTSEATCEGSHRRYRINTSAEDIRNALHQTAFFKRCLELQKRLL